MAAAGPLQGASQMRPATVPTPRMSDPRAQPRLLAKLPPREWPTTNTRSRSMQQAAPIASTTASKSA